jgi:hypothetical protein
MTRPGGGDTINRGPSPRRAERAPEAAGNVREKGGDPSPDDRDRGEASDANPPAPVDLDTTRERAS